MKWLSFLHAGCSNATRKSANSSRTSLCIFIILCSLLICPTISQGGSELCTDEDCTCDSNDETDLIDVICRCSPKKDPLRIAGKENPHNALFLPEKTRSLRIEGCHHVEVFAKTFNHAAHLKNVTISGCGKAILHPRMYHIGSGTPPKFSLFEINNVPHLQVERHAFDGISIEGTFQLMDVTMEKIESFAFNFDYVHDFIIDSSRIDRIAMWGIKPKRCDAFSILRGSRFYSLARNAFEFQCNTFMLAYNTFDSLHEASLNVKSGLIDIQGNTFESFTGKPFYSLEPIAQKDGQGPPAHFTFRENKFKADPTLPFNALAMPAFDAVNEANSYVIEMNHFLCDCNKVAWLIGAMTHGFDRDVIANGRGSLDFLQKLYDTSGQCLECDLRTCTPIEGRAFRNFAQEALIKHKGQLKCSESGQPLKSQRPGAHNELGGENQEYSEEEDLANVKNKEWSSELLKDTQASNGIRIKVVESYTSVFIFLLISAFTSRKMHISIG